LGDSLHSPGHSGTLVLSTLLCCHPYQPDESLFARDIRVGIIHSGLAIQLIFCTIRRIVCTWLVRQNYGIALSSSQMDTTTVRIYSVITSSWGKMYNFIGHGWLFPRFKWVLQKAVIHHGRLMV
jgi:hypothetical protein